MDLGDAFNAGADWVTSAPLVSFFVGSPLWGALLVTALVAVIGYAFLDCTSIPRKTQFKTLFYIFVSVLVVLYLHYFVVQNTLKHDVGLEAGRALMRIGPTGGGVQGGAHMPVVPRDVAQGALPPAQPPPALPPALPPAPPSPYAAAAAQAYAAQTYAAQPGPLPVADPELWGPPPLPPA